MQGGNDSSGVSNCYIFKSRLQEYAQKAGITTPVYETVKEGLSHEPVFRSSVIVNGVRYDSLPGFFNRKAAEQSAAEVALQELMRDGRMADCIPNPVQETGLCKNLLQEYSQKRSYPIPNYICKREGTPNQSSFTCTVEIGGIRYIGGSARTKKEAEIKAARTALLAIQENNYKPRANAHVHGGQVYNVVPGMRKMKETATPSEMAKALQTRKGKFKKKSSKKRFGRLKSRRGVDPMQNGQEGENTTVVQDVEVSSASGKEMSSHATQTSVMPNLVGNQLVELLRVVMQNRQGVLSPLMPGILSRPPGLFGPVIQNLSSVNPATANVDPNPDSRSVELECASQEMQPRQHGVGNSDADNSIGQENISNINRDDAAGAGYSAQESQLDQSSEKLPLGGAKESVVS